MNSVDKYGNNSSNLGVGTIEFNRDVETTIDFNRDVETTIEFSRDKV